jgi:hypothetical protein
MEKTGDIFTGKRLEFLLAVAGVIIPSVGSLDEKGRRRFAAIVNVAMSDKPPKVVGQFKFFLFMLRWMTLPFFLRPFDRLGITSQTRVMRFLEYFPIGLVRTGIWGLKALVFMGYYGQPAISKAIGYTPSMDGNEVLRARHGV